MEDLEILSELSLSGVDSTDEKRGNSKAKKDETLLKLQKEREVIEKLENCPIALKLILEEIGRVSSGRQDPLKSVDLNRDIPINLHTRIKIPCKEFPKFNFVGRLLGPRGTSLQKLQQDTQTKMTVGGRGCMKDKNKEEELRQSKDPKFAHLHEELHLDVHAYASPSLAHARMAYALSELRKFLIPVSDKTDDISQAQLRQMEILNAGGDINGANGPALMPPLRPFPNGQRNPTGMPSFPDMRNGMQRFGGNMPNGQSNIIQQQTSAEINRQKVMSILDKARKNQMEFASGNSAIGLGSYHSNYGDGYFGGNGDYGGGYAGHGQQGMGSGVNAMQANQRRSAALWL